MRCPGSVFEEEAGGATIDCVYCDTHLAACLLPASDTMYGWLRAAIYMDP